MRSAALAVSMALSWTGMASADSWGHKASVENKIQKKIDSLSGDATALRAFVAVMPKGADLHSHVSGAVTMEKVIQWGAEDGACVDSVTFTASNPCKAGQIPLSNALADETFYRDVLAAWSMEGFAGPLLDAHQHFFDAFGKFGAVLSDARSDDILADILSTAGKNRQIYVELMQGFGSSTVATVASKYMNADDTWTEAYLLGKRTEIIADPLFGQTLDATLLSLRTSLMGARALLGCATAAPDPGCGVQARFLLSANRTKDRASVFAQWVYAFELAQAAPEIVGVNLVSPEEHPNSLLYYNDEMMAVNVLHRFNEQDSSRLPVHVSLHAGELIPEVLPQTPEGQRHLTFHIRNAVDLARAERIGHGVDILLEVAGKGVRDLFKTMRKNDVMVEICLTSNDALLGKKGASHPLGDYLQNRVPVALATDDEGILRNDITTEYVRAVTEHQIRYSTLKDMIRASLEHSFLPGKSLWKNPSQYSAPAPECRKDNPRLAQTSQECASFLAGSERAAQQWKLEGELAAFEDSAL
jgi:adenosine deaminase